MAEPDAYLKSGWVNGLSVDLIRTGKTGNGLAMATADARTDNWRFRIKVIQIGSQVYRFITAAPANDHAIVSISDEITETFRLLTETERKALAPLRIHLLRVEPGDNLGRIAARMRGTEQPLKLLRVLNGLGPGDMPEPGTVIKIVNES